MFLLELFMYYLKDKSAMGASNLLGALDMLSIDDGCIWNFSISDEAWSISGALSAGEIQLTTVSTSLEKKKQHIYRAHTIYRAMG
jgi:hypothetical protein